MGVIREKLLDAEVVNAIMKTARRLAARKDLFADRERAQRALSRVEADISRLVNAIRKVGISEALSGALQGAERRRDDLVGQIDRMPATMTRVTRAGVEAALGELRDALEGGVRVGRAEMAKQIDRIEIPASGPVTLYPAPGAWLALVLGKEVAFWTHPY